MKKKSKNACIISRACVSWWRLRRFHWLTMNALAGLVCVCVCRCVPLACLTSILFPVPSSLFFTCHPCFARLWMCGCVSVFLKHNQRLDNFEANWPPTSNWSCHLAPRRPGRSPLSQKWAEWACHEMSRLASRWQSDESEGMIDDVTGN